MGLVAKRIEMVSALIPLMTVKQFKVSLTHWGRKEKRKVKKRTRDGC